MLVEYDCFYILHAFNVFSRNGTLKMMVISRYSHVADYVLGFVCLSVCLIKFCKQDTTRSNL